jgi:hypothetical protein
MQWKLIHEDVDVLDNSEVVSRTSIIFEHEGTKTKIGDTLTVQNHLLGTKQVLVDTAYELQNLARQMLKKADSLQ